MAQMNGAPAGGGGLEQLLSLVGPALQTPQGQAMAKAVMSAMASGGQGGDPRAAMAAAPMGAPTGQDSGNPAVNMHGGSMMGRGPATDGELEGMVGTQNNMRSDMPQSGYPPQDMMGNDGRFSNQGMTTEQELDMARQMMGQDDGQGGGPRGGAPTPQGPQGQALNDGPPTPQEVQMLKSKPTPRNIQNFDMLFGQGAADLVLNGGQAPQPHGPGESDYNDNQGHVDDSDHDYR